MDIEFSRKWGMIILLLILDRGTVCGCLFLKRVGHDHSVPYPKLRECLWFLNSSRRLSLIILFFILSWEKFCDYWFFKRVGHDHSVPYPKLREGLWLLVLHGHYNVDFSSGWGLIILFLILNWGSVCGCWFCKRVGHDYSVPLPERCRFFKRVGLDHSFPYPKLRESLWILIFQEGGAWSFCP